MTELSVVGLCGTHGTGKSTILQAVKAAGYPVVDTQLSRTAQAVLGWDSLKYAQESEENMWALQDAIMQAMYDRDLQITKSGIVTLVDRTPADLWGYAKLWSNRLGGKVDQDRLSAYKATCRYLAGTMYRRQLIVPIREEIPFVAEANRADEASREFHAKEVEDFVVGGGLPHAIIESIHIDYRLVEVIERMKQD
jgi:predicted ATPase